jgi:hypothetical protein
MWGGGFPAKRAAAVDKLQEPAQEQEEDWGALAEKQLASIKRDTQASFEDAMVCATHKVMAEFEAQPVQEPVAWGFRSADGAIYDCISPEAHDECEGSYTVPLYTTPPLPAQPAQEAIYGINQDDWKDVVAAITKVRDGRGIYLGCRPADVFKDWFFALGTAKVKEKNG